MEETLLHVDCPKIRFEQKTNNNIDSSFFILPYKLRSYLGKLSLFHVNLQYI